MNEYSKQKISEDIEALEASFDALTVIEYFRRVRLAEISMEHYCLHCKGIAELNGERAKNIEKLNKLQNKFISLTIIACILLFYLDDEKIILISLFLYLSLLATLAASFINVKSDDSSRLSNIIACESEKMQIARASEAIGIDKDILNNYAEDFDPSLGRWENSFESDEIKEKRNRAKLTMLVARKSVAEKMTQFI